MLGICSSFLPPSRSSSFIISGRKGLPITDWPEGFSRMSSPLLVTFQLLRMSDAFGGKTTFCIFSPSRTRNCETELLVPFVSGERKFRTLKRKAGKLFSPLSLSKSAFEIWFWKLFRLVCRKLDWVSPVLDVVFFVLGKTFLRESRWRFNREMAIKWKLKARNFLSRCLKTIHSSPRKVFPDLTKLWKTWENFKRFLSSKWRDDRKYIPRVDVFLFFSFPLFFFVARLSEGRSKSRNFLCPNDSEKADWGALRNSEAFWWNWNSH